MKKSLITIIIILVLTIINAQGITNILGGNSESDKFIIENKNGDNILIATGKGQVSIGNISPDISGYPHKLYVQGDVSGIFVNSEGDIVFGVLSKSIGSNAKGFWADVEGNGAQGVFATVRGNSASAVEGWALGSDPDNISHAGHFYNQGPNGYGVYGTAPKYPVYGKATANSGFHYGGFFEASGASGRGVYATSSTTSGSAYGGVFEAKNSPDGIGVYAAGKKYDFYAAGAGIDYHSSSSIRWKRDIVEINNPLEKLSEIRGVYFNWDEEHGGEHDIGCIAEEVGKILPEIVVYEENGIDTDGMDYSKLTPLLVEAVKALTKRIEELENR